MISCRLAPCVARCPLGDALCSFVDDAGSLHVVDVGAAWGSSALLAALPRRLVVAGDAPIEAHAWSAGGRLLAVSWRNVVRLFACERARAGGAIAADAVGDHTLYYYPRTLAIADDHDCRGSAWFVNCGGPDGVDILKVWLARKECRVEHWRHLLEKFAVSLLAINESRERQCPSDLAIAAYDGHLGVWPSCVDQQCWVQLHEAGLTTSLCFSPDNHYLALGSWCGTVRVLRRVTKQQRQQQQHHKQHRQQHHHHKHPQQQHLQQQEHKHQHQQQQQQQQQQHHHHQQQHLQQQEHKQQQQQQQQQQHHHQQQQQQQQQGTSEVYDNNDDDADDDNDTGDEWVTDGLLAVPTVGHSIAGTTPATLCAWLPDSQALVVSLDRGVSVYHRAFAMYGASDGPSLWVCLTVREAPHPLRGLLVLRDKAVLVMVGRNHVTTMLWASSQSQRESRHGSNRGDTVTGAFSRVLADDESLGQRVLLGFDDGGTSGVADTSVVASSLSSPRLCLEWTRDMGTSREECLSLPIEFVSITTAGASAVLVSRRLLVVVAEGVVYVHDDMADADGVRWAALVPKHALVGATLTADGALVLAELHSGGEDDDVKTVTVSLWRWSAATGAPVAVVARHAVLQMASASLCAVTVLSSRETDSDEGTCPSFALAVDLPHDHQIVCVCNARDHELVWSAPSDPTPGRVCAVWRQWALLRAHMPNEWYAVHPAKGISKKITFDGTWGELLKEHSGSLGRLAEAV